MAPTNGPATPLCRDEWVKKVEVDAGKRADLSTDMAASEAEGARVREPRAAAGERDLAQGFRGFC